MESTYEELQAAYIQKFINYIEWPQSNSSQFVIAVLHNENEYVAMKNALQGKQIQGRTVVVEHIRTPDLSQNIQMLHVKEMDLSTVKELQKFNKSPILVISQDLEELSKEVVINFFLENGKLRFDINVEKANNINIKINSRLLKLARKIK